MPSSLPPSLTAPHPSPPPFHPPLPPPRPSAPADAQAAALQKDLDAARAARSKADSKLSSLQAEKEVLAKSLAADYGPGSALSALRERCVSGHVDKYEYEICPYKQVGSGWWVLGWVQTRTSRSLSEIPPREPPLPPLTTKLLRSCRRPRRRAAATRAWGRGRAWRTAAPR